MKKKYQKVHLFHAILAKNRHLEGKLKAKSTASPNDIKMPVWSKMWALSAISYLIETRWTLFHSEVRLIEKFFFIQNFMISTNENIKAFFTSRFGRYSFRIYSSLKHGNKNRYQLFNQHLINFLKIFNFEILEMIFQMAILH